MDIEQIKRIRSIQIQSKRLVTASMMGRYLSRFKGQGLHFEDVRQYENGDDIRAIDWNVSARAGKLHVKRFREERELSICHLIDISLSMDCGYGRRNKLQSAAEVAGALSYSAMCNQDRVGCGLLADKLESWIPVRKGRNHSAIILGSILSIECKTEKVDFQRSLEEASRHLPNSSVVFLYSDFMDPVSTENCLKFSRRYDLVPIWLQDPWDYMIPPVGILNLRDPENPDRLISLQSYDEKAVAKFLDLKQQHRERIKKLFNKQKADYIELIAGRDFVRPLVKFFKLRGKA